MKLTNEVDLIKTKEFLKEIHKNKEWVGSPETGSMIGVAIEDIEDILSKHLKGLPKKKEFLIKIKVGNKWILDDIIRINYKDVFEVQEGYNQCLKDCEETP